MKELIDLGNGKTREIELDVEGEPDAGIMYTELKNHKLELKHPYKMLSVGCGKGLIVEYFRDHGVEAYGIDIRNVFPKNKGYFVLGNIYRMPFLDGTFDLVSECFTFDYVRLTNKKYGEQEVKEKVNKMLTEMNRVLKPEGYLFSSWGQVPKDHLFSLGYKRITHPASQCSFIYQKPKN